MPDCCDRAMFKMVSQTLKKDNLLRIGWRKLIAKLTFLALIALISNLVAAMSLFNAGETCVFSSVQIRITLDKEPLKEAKVIRRWEWNEKKGEDYAFTDSDGIVEFAEILQRGATQFFPSEFVAAQQIVAVIEGKEDRIWSFSKRSPDRDSELEGKPLNLSCEISSKETMYRDFGPALFTKCTWGTE